MLVASATALKQEGAKNKKSLGNPTISATKTTATDTVNSTGTLEWKFKNVRKTTMCLDTRGKYGWCKLHGRKNKKRVQNGMYMLHPHNH